MHEGFAKALEQVWTTVEGMLNGSSSKTIFTGHSLGAALATLAASLRPPAHLCTFGSPRVGNNEFAESLQRVNARRYADCCDVVAQLPPESAAYTHVGELHYLDRFGNAKVGPNRLAVTIDQLLARGDYLQAHAWKSGNAGLRDLADHAPINYVYGVTP